LKRIAIFASGSGSNAASIMRHFATHESIKVALVVSNKADAGVLDRAKDNKVPTLVVNRADYQDSGFLLAKLQAFQIDFVVLAGFLRLIPEWLVEAYPSKILNIHPALLPKFGGKGMYGMHIHEAVKASGEKETGLTIHLVNTEYDKGAPLFQIKCPVWPCDSATEISSRVLSMEHQFYPKVIDAYISAQK
jgi:phosphoribosylglycinamide formyltransferase 1